MARPTPLSTPPTSIWLAICQSRDQTTLSHGEWWERSWWRSALDPFNAASTSNNSHLWQLCIIHLVEFLSLSPFPPWCSSLSPSPLSGSLQLFLFFYFFLPPVPPGDWRRREGEPGQCSIRCCLFPPDTSDFGDTEVFVCSTLPRPCEFCMPSEPDCVRSSIETRCLKPLPQHGVWNYYLKKQKCNTVHLLCRLRRSISD